MDDLYFEVNPSDKKILGPPINLDVNWGNISGIIFLNKDELYDLSWCGHPNFGFVKICNENKELIKTLSYDENTLNLLKARLRSTVAESRREKELDPLLIDNLFSIQLTEKFKLHMIMKYHECILDNKLKFNWKTISGFIEFDSEKFINLYKKVQVYIQNLFDLELELNKKIEKCKNIESLMDLDLKICYNTNISL